MRLAKCGQIQGLQLLSHTACLQGLLVTCMMDAERLRTDAAQEGEQGNPMGEDGNPLPPQDGLSQHLLCKAYFDERAAQCAPVQD